MGKIKRGKNVDKDVNVMSVEDDEKVKIEQKKINEMSRKGNGYMRNNIHEHTWNKLMNTFRKNGWSARKDDKSDKIILVSLEYEKEVMETEMEKMKWVKLDDMEEKKWNKFWNANKK